MASSSTSGQPGHTSTGHPTGMWSTLPVSMPINPIHAALLHTGKILVVSGSGNCPPTLAGCPHGPQYSQGAALLDLSSNKITTMPTGWDMFCNGMSIMQDGRVLINGGHQRIRIPRRRRCQRRNSVYRSTQHFNFRPWDRVDLLTWLLQHMGAGTQPSLN